MYYTLYTPSYLISGSPVKRPQTMYWTYGTFANSGHTVSVPAGAVNSIHIAFNSVFPEKVSAAYADPNYVPPTDATNAYQEFRTLWLDTGAIQAYNLEGRVSPNCSARRPPTARIGSWVLKSSTFSSPRRRWTLRTTWASR